MRKISETLQEIFEFFPFHPIIQFRKTIRKSYKTPKLKNNIKNTFFEHSVFIFSPLEMEPIDSAKTQNTQINQNTDKQKSPQPILEKEKDERLELPYHKLDDFLDSLSNEHLKIVWSFVTDNDSLFYLSEFPRNDLKKEICEQIEMCKKMNIEEFQTDEKNHGLDLA